MTRDEIVRTAREAGCVKEEWAEVNCRFLDRFAALVADTARLEGWQAAREMAAKVCDGIAKKMYDHNLPQWPVKDCAAAIRAMQTPDEWAAPCSCGDKYPAGSDGAAFIAAHGYCENCAVVTPACGEAPSTEWPHEDGFAGGLTERRIDDGEGEESKKTT